MKAVKIFIGLSALSLVLLLTAAAQLAVTVSPPKIVGQKALVKLAMKNGLSQKIESARAVCFLLDDQGTMVGQSTKWVIGSNKTGLEPGATNNFNFVVTGSQPFTTTNLAVKISFTRVVLEGGKLAGVPQNVVIRTATK